MISSNVPVSVGTFIQALRTNKDRKEKIAKKIVLRKP